MKAGKNTKPDAGAGFYRQNPRIAGFSMVQFESVNGPILYGGAVIDRDSQVIWLRPSIWLAARDPEMGVLWQW